MKTTFRAAAPAALAMLLATPAGAADLFGEPAYHEAGASAISGRLELRGAYEQTETLDVDGPDAMAGRLSGTFNLRLGSQANVQLDAYGLSRSREGYDQDGYGGTLHVYARPEGGAFAGGTFASLESLRFDSEDTVNGGTIETDVASYLGGVEMAYLGQAYTVLARLGYGEGTRETAGLELSYDRYLAELGLRYYVTPNVRLDLGGNLQRRETVGASLNSYGVEGVANWRPGGGGYSIYGGVSRDRFDETDTTLVGVFGGARFHFGTGSLQDEDRSGALWSPVASLE